MQRYLFSTQHPFCLTRGCREHREEGEAAVNPRQRERGHGSDCTTDTDRRRLRSGVTAWSSRPRIRVLEARKGLQSSPDQPTTHSGSRLTSALEALIFTIFNLLAVWLPSSRWRTQLPPSPLQQPRLWSPSEQSEVPSWQGKTGGISSAWANTERRAEGKVRKASHTRGHAAGARPSPHRL